MQAACLETFGEPSVLKLQDRPAPGDAGPLGSQDLLLDVATSSVNPVDHKIRSGAFRAPLNLPLIPGYDVCGTVVAVGDSVAAADEPAFQVGDVVWGMPSLFLPGAHAEQIAIDHRRCSKKPKSLSDVEAGVLPLVTLTAWLALFDRGQLAQGQTVLIQGGGGGVGHVAIQLAKAHGARVLATASRPASIDLCKRLGVDAVINHQTENVVEAVKALTDGQGCQLVLDCVGQPVIDDCIQATAFGGKLVTIVGIPPTTNLGPMMLKNADVLPVFVDAYGLHQQDPSRLGQILEQAALLADAGKLKPHISVSLPLSQLAQAHELVATGHVAGKVGIHIR